MKISFLITFYNQKEFVKQSLDSILAVNKPFEWEILVGDDGSTDGTIDIVHEYIQKYPLNIFLYCMERKPSEYLDIIKRVSDNRLNLLEKCSGDYFCIMDGDDYYLDNDFIYESINIFENHEDVSIVSFGYSIVKNGYIKKEYTIPLHNHNYVNTRYYIRHQYIHAGSCVYKKTWPIDRINYIKKNGYFDDNDIVINSLNYGKMFHINKSIYAYRDTEKGLYTSLNTLKRALLNVQGYDVDIHLLDLKNKNDLIYRYSYSILLVFLLKKQLKEILGEDDYLKNQYISKNLGFSTTYSLLNYQSLSKEKYKELNKLIFRIILLRPINSFITIVRFILRRFSL